MSPDRQRAAVLLREHEQRVERSIGRLRDASAAYTHVPGRIVSALARTGALAAIYFPSLSKLMRH